MFIGISTIDPLFGAIINNGCQKISFIKVLKKRTKGKISLFVGYGYPKKRNYKLIGRENESFSEGRENER